MSHCPIHQNVLEEDFVLVRFGLYRLSPEFRYAIANLFPESHLYVLGGCVVQKWLWQRVLFCQECRNQYQRWITHYPDFGLSIPSAAEIERCTRRYLGDPDFRGVVPAEFESVLRERGLLTAVKFLKAANPVEEIQVLRQHAQFWQRKIAYEKDWPQKPKYWL